MNKRERTLWERVALFIGIAGCLACPSCATAAQGLVKFNAGRSAEQETLITISATVDGSGRFIFTSSGLRYAHKSWGPPTHVKFNAGSWDNLDQTPKMWPHIAEMLDLSRARLVERKGRDTIALEHTSEGFDLYFCDAPNGASAYSATVAIPRRVGKQ